MAKIMQLTDGRYLLGSETFTELELVARYRRGSALLVRDAEGLRVLRGSDALGVRVVDILAIGDKASAGLVRFARLRLERGRDSRRLPHLRRKPAEPCQSCGLVACGCNVIPLRRRT